MVNITDEQRFGFFRLILQGETTKNLMKMLKLLKEEIDARDPETDDQVEKSSFDANGSPI